MTVTSWNNGNRWSPPEYVEYDAEDTYVGPGHPTKEGDVWMYSMTMLACAVTLSFVYVQFSNTFHLGTIFQRISVR
jgi:hypothetical protein